MIADTFYREDPARPSGGPPPRHVRSLDGMRAVGVTLVVLFHLQVPGFRAGYLGVDVFFVLSGFLITSLLIAEMDRTGGIALVAFWSRRIRRLLPALTLLLLAVATVTWFVATFSERASIRGDLLASATYLANWRFISTSSYFLNTGIESPLQHTWSLAIEEQFYLLWPLLLAGSMALLHRAKLSVTVLASLGVVASAIAMAALYGPDGVERAYMGTDARLFEPLLGSLGAVLVARPGFRAWLERHGMPILWLGTFGLIAGLAVIRPGDALYYRGGAVVFSTATLMMVASLWVIRSEPIGAALSLRPIAWIGVVSYGIYLWHWPMILWLGVRQAVGVRAFLLGSVAVFLTLVISAVSYYTVELPIRRGRADGAHARRGWMFRRPGLVLASVPVVLLIVASVSVAATTVPLPASGVPVVMLAGDSVPLHLEVAFEKTSSARGWRMVSAAQGGCPVSGETSTKITGEVLHEAAGCASITAPSQDSLIDQVDPDVVVWWDRWSLSSFITPDGERVKTGTDRFWTLRSATLDATVRRLAAQGARVVFVATEPPGEGVWSLCGGERCLPDWSRFQIDHYDDITTRWNAILRRYAADHPDVATYVSVTDEICRDESVPCNDMIGDAPARPDGTHYEGAGEVEVTTLLAELVSPMMSPS